MKNGKVDDIVSLLFKSLLQNNNAVIFKQCNDSVLLMEYEHLFHHVFNHRTQDKIQRFIQCLMKKAIFSCVQLLPNFPIRLLSVGHPVRIEYILTGHVYIDLFYWPKNE